MTLSIIISDSYFYKKKENEVSEFHYILLKREKGIFSLIYFMSTKTYSKVLYLFWNSVWINVKA